MAKKSRIAWTEKETLEVAVESKRLLAEKVVFGWSKAILMAQCNILPKELHKAFSSIGGNLAVTIKKLAESLPSTDTEITPAKDAPEERTKRTYAKRNIVWTTPEYNAILEKLRGCTLTLVNIAICVYKVQKTELPKERRKTYAAIKE